MQWAQTKEHAIQLQGKVANSLSYMLSSLKCMGVESCADEGAQVPVAGEGCKLSLNHYVKAEMYGCGIMQTKEHGF